MPSCRWMFVVLGDHSSSLGVVAETTAYSQIVTHAHKSERLDRLLLL